MHILTKRVTLVINSRLLQQASTQYAAWRYPRFPIVRMAEVASWPHAAACTAAETRL